MKKYLIYTYLLFVLLITGAFASMAQNDYGTTLLGLVAALFSFLFMLQLKDTFHYLPNSRIAVIELICLIVISAVVALRIFDLSARPIEWVFNMAVAALIFVYIRRLIDLSKAIKPAGNSFFVLILIFYASLVVYLLSTMLSQLLPSSAGLAGITGFMLLIVFAIGAWTAKPAVTDGEKVSAFQYIFNLKDRSVMLMCLFLLFSLYTGFTRIGWLPQMYSSALPQSYYKLLNDSETNKTLPVNGKYPHEEFKSQYEQLVKNHFSDKD
jgi:hypothetical protein